MEKQPSLQIQRTSMLNTINGVGKVLRAIKMDPFRLNAESIIAKAVRKSGYYIELPQTEEGLHRLVSSINQEGKPNPFGALAVKALLERTLYGRYKIEQYLAAHPEIEEEEITEPVFIIGMPRTGTTILHALMHEDKAHRSPLAWECLLPHPVHTPETFTNNSQLNTVTKEFDQLFKLVPDFRKKHYMAADSPQECLGITALDFNSFQFSAQLYLPSYMHWFAHESDQLSSLKFHKRFLQYLQSGGVKGKRWLLKSPVHLLRLPELFEVYPDARIVMTHRYPEDIISSAASLISSVRSLYTDHEDIRITGKEQLETWSLYFGKFMESRQKLKKEDQIIDLKFHDFIKDQIGVTADIYKKFNWDLDDETRNSFRSFLDENPKDKHGKHIYAPEILGLTTEMIRKEFGTYMEFLEKL